MTKRKRAQFAIGLKGEWQVALKESLLSQFPTERSSSSLARRVVEDFVICLLPEPEMRQYGILAQYESPRRPDIVITAARHYLAAHPDVELVPLKTLAREEADRKSRVAAKMSGGSVTHAKKFATK